MISKKQAELLTAVRENKIPLGDKFYDSNPLLKSLVDEKYVIWIRGDDDSTSPTFDSFNHEISGYKLSSKGIDRLESYIGQSEQNAKMGLKYPLLVNAIIAVVGYLCGFVSPYILHLIKWMAVANPSTQPKIKNNGPEHLIRRVILFFFLSENVPHLSGVISPPFLLFWNVWNEINFYFHQNIAKSVIVTKKNILLWNLIKFRYLIHHF